MHNPSKQIRIKLIRTKEKLGYNYTGLFLFKLFPLPKYYVVLKCEEQYLLLFLIDWEFIVKVIPIIHLKMDEAYLIKATDICHFIPLQIKKSIDKP